MYLKRYGDFQFWNQSSAERSDIVKNTVMLLYHSLYLYIGAGLFESWLALSQD